MSAPVIMRTYPNDERERRMLDIYLTMQKNAASLEPIPCLELIVSKLIEDPEVFQELFFISKLPLWYFAELCCGMVRSEVEASALTSTGDAHSTPGAEPRPSPPLRRSKRVEDRRLGIQTNPGRPLNEETHVGAAQQARTSRKRTRSGPGDNDDKNGRTEETPQTEDGDTSRPPKRARKTRPAPRRLKK